MKSSVDKQAPYDASPEIVREDMLVIISSGSLRCTGCRPFHDDKDATLSEADERVSGATFSGFVTAGGRP